MAIGPLADEAAECPIEALRSEDLLTQQNQSQCRLEVADGMTVLARNHIGIRKNDRRLRIPQQGQDVIDRIAASRGVFLIALRTVHSLLEGVRLVYVDKGVEALIHPGVTALIKADHHRKPGVADLVCGEPEQLLAAQLAAVEEQSGILHARDLARDIDSGGIRIGEPA